MIRNFRYDQHGQAARPDFVGEVSRPVDDEGLTGLVRGQDASDLEERLARSFRRYKKRFEFQVDIPTRTSLPGQNRKVDFIVDGVQPVEPKGYISHYRTIAQKGDDMVRELLLNEYFRQNGLRPLISIPYYKLETQDMADRWVRANL